MTQIEEIAMRALKVSPGDRVSVRQWQLATQLAEIVLGVLREPVAGVEPPPVAAQAPPLGYSARKVSQLKGYTGDTCQDCGNLSMVRNGTCLKCDTCGATSGCS